MNGIKVFVEVVVNTNFASNADIEDSIQRGMDDLRAYGMAKITGYEACEYPEYEEWKKGEIRDLEFSGKAVVHIG